MKDPFLRRLRLASMKKLTSPPRNYLTRHQWAARWDRAPQTAGALITRAVALGLMKRKVFRVLMNGVPRCIPHYCQVR